MAALHVVPADDAPWDDVAAVFGTRGDGARCWCQRYSYTDGWIWHGAPEMHRESLQAQVEERGAGLIAYQDDEPVGWCALGPRPSYPRLLKMPVPWKERAEDKSDPGVWAVTCMLVRAGFVSGLSRMGSSRAFIRSRMRSVSSSFPSSASL